MKRTKIAILLSLLLVLSLTMSAFADTQANPLNRLDLVKNLLKLNDIEVEEATTSSFRDVTTPEDIAYVETATKQGIASGYAGNFDPASIVTKEQAVTMVLKSFGELDLANKVTAEVIENTITFDDKASISTWARPYVALGILNNIIDPNETVFNPQADLTIEDLTTLVSKARTAFTRDGMTATQLLAKVSDDLLEYETMKYHLEMDMVSNTKDLSDEDNITETDAVMKMLLEAVMDQANDRVYAVNTVIIEAGDESIETSTEMIMDNYVMYIKAPGVEGWMAQDINPMMQELEALLGTSIETNTGISQKQMEYFGMKASYLNDVTLDGQDYYVVLISVDKETFKIVIDEVLEKILDLTTDLMGAEELSGQDEEEMKLAIKMMMSELLQNLDMEIQYKYYINQETKLLDKADIEQVMTMVMGPIENHTTSTGSLYFYDFNEPVEIPEIQEEDIFSLSDMMDTELVVEEAVVQEAVIEEAVVEEAVQ